MAFSGFNSQGGVHPCFPFYERLIFCMKEEISPVKMCYPFTEDYLECINRKKQVIFFLFFLKL